MDSPGEIYAEHLNRSLRPARDSVAGLHVGTTIDNRDSIDATLEDCIELEFVRVVELDSFESKSVADLFVAANDHRRCERLAEQIEASGRIDPLIVAFDAEGPYIIEGAHRLGALMLLGKKALPALVVVDLSPTAWRGRPPEDASAGERR